MSMCVCSRFLHYDSTEKVIIPLVLIEKLMKDVGSMACVASAVDNTLST